MFMFEDMAIDALAIVAIMLIVFIFGYVLTAIVGEWRSEWRAGSARRRRRARIRAVHSSSTGRAKA